MEDEIILDRGGQSMDLDDDEQELMNEIEVGTRTFNVGKKKKARFHEDDDLEEPDAFMNPSKTQPERRQVTREEPIDYGEPPIDDEPPPMYKAAPSVTQVTSENPEDEKADILNKLNRLSQKKGVHVNKSLNMYSSLEDLRSELRRAKYAVEVEQSVKFSRRMLVACITGVEFLNKRYDPFDLKLEGWSESVMENVDDYDEVFEELYAKYRSNMKVAPEIKLMMMVGGSGMMFHLTNSMFKSVMPNVNDVMRQNPDLMTNMMNAVTKTMSGGGSGLPPPPEPGPTESGGAREMRGPGIDLSALMGNLSMPQPPKPENTFTGDLNPVQQAIPEDDGDVSDIVSVISTEDVKDLNISAPKKKRGRKPKKTSGNEVSV